MLRLSYCFRFVMQHDGSCMVYVLLHKKAGAKTPAIVGCSSASQLRDTISSIDRLDFSEEELRLIDAAAGIDKV